MHNLNSERIWDTYEYNKTSKARIYTAFSVLSNNNYKFQGDERVLDIGCGIGSITAEIANQVPRGEVVGIDVSQDMISYAKNKFENTNLFFVQLDATKMNYFDEFDVVVSFACLHWIKNQKLVLKNIENSLRNGGQAFLMLYMKNKSFWDAIEQLIGSDNWHKYFIDFKDGYCDYTEKNYRQEVKSTNLKIEKLEQINAPEDEILSKSDFISRVKGWLPYLQVLPKSLWDQFLNDLYNICKNKLGHQRKNDGDISRIVFPRLEIKLMK